VPSDYASLGIKALWELHDGRMHEYRKLNEKYAVIKTLPKGKKSSLLDVKVELAARIMERCQFCEIRCGANRYKRPGACGVNATSHYYSEFLHRGEEPELVPSHTIFFEGCTFACAYCQNWTIATEIRGNIVDPRDLAEVIEVRHKEGSKNVNLVGGDPTPHLHTILQTVNYLTSNIPVVWNSNMFGDQRGEEGLGHPCVEERRETALGVDRRQRQLEAMHAEVQAAVNEVVRGGAGERGQQRPPGRHAHQRNREQRDAGHRERERGAFASFALQPRLVRRGERRLQLVLGHP
jgi:hypothetical protein